VAVIGQKALSNCDALEDITIPEGVTTIEERAFYNCGGITSIYIPASVASIAVDDRINMMYWGFGASAFAGCVGLAEIVVDGGNIDYYDAGGILYDASTDEPVCIPLGISGHKFIADGVTSIPSYFFKGRVGLTGVTIPSSVTSIGDGAFEGCVNLTSVTISSGTVSIGEGAFEGCSKLTDIILPSSLISIGNNAFYDCGALTSIILPSSVTSIGDNAFYDTALTTVYYCGDGTEFGYIAVGTGNDELIYADVYYYSETRPAAGAYGYWYYDSTTMAGIKIL